MSIERKEKKVARLGKKLEKVEGKAAGAGAGAFGSRIGQLKTQLSTATSRLDTSREKMGGTISKATDPNYKLMSGFTSKPEEGKMTVKKGDIKTSTVKGDLGGELSGFVESDFAQPLTGEAAEKFILSSLGGDKSETSSGSTVKNIPGISGETRDKAIITTPKVESKFSNVAESSRSYKRTTPLSKKEKRQEKKGDRYRKREIARRQKVDPSLFT